MQGGVTITSSQPQVVHEPMHPSFKRPYQAPLPAQASRSNDQILSAFLLSHDAPTQLAPIKSIDVNPPAAAPQMYGAATFAEGYSPYSSSDIIFSSGAGQYVDLAADYPADSLGEIKQLPEQLPSMAAEFPADILGDIKQLPEQLPCMSPATEIWADLLWDDDSPHGPAANLSTRQSQSQPLGNNIGDIIGWGNEQLWAQANLLGSPADDGFQFPDGGNAERPVGSVTDSGGLTASQARGEYPAGPMYAGSEAFGPGQPPANPHFHQHHVATMAGSTAYASQAAHVPSPSPPAVVPAYNSRIQKRRSSPISHPSTPDPASAAMGFIAKAESADDQVLEEGIQESIHPAAICQPRLSQQENGLLTLLHSLARPAADGATGLLLDKYDALRGINEIRGEVGRTPQYNTMYRQHIQVIPLNAWSQVRSCVLLSVNLQPVS